MTKTQVHALDPARPLAHVPLSAVLSTTDLDRARRFYEHTLGLRVVDANPEEVRFEAGQGTQLLVYRRGEAPKAENTAAGFQVHDLKATVDALTQRGVRFEEYDLPGLKTVHGVVSGDGWSAAWFKDPDGNIVAVSQGR